MKGELPTAIEQIIPRHQETEGTSDDEIKIKSPCTTFLQDIVRQCWDGAQYRAIAKNLLDQHKSRSHGSGSPPSQSPLATNAPSVLSVGREHVHSELTFKANQPSAELEARPSTSALAEGADAGSLHSGRRPNLPVSSGARDVGDPASTTDKNLVRESTTWAQLSEEEVLSALNDYVTSAVTRAGPLINPHGADDGATADSISGPPRVGALQSSALLHYPFREQHCNQPARACFGYFKAPKRTLPRFCNGLDEGTSEELERSQGEDSDEHVRNAQ
ncbi:hypothetical protein FRC09_003299 [Ceratobasidium sp. 395]|nr:hypothetical protein FRC09_003299 [Ceratobasidium sp. 395]